MNRILSSTASCCSNLCCSKSASLRNALVFPQVWAIIVFIAAIIHIIIIISTVDDNRFDTKSFGYQLRPDIEHVLTAIKDGDLDTTPYNRSNLLPPFLRYSEVFEVKTSPRYQTSVCMIPKSMSTLAMSIFCYLRSPAKFKAHGRLISSERWHRSLCGERNVIRNRPDAEDLLGSTRIAFIRDPIDRFLSGFVNKCILKGPYEFVEYCFDCKSDLNCFVEAFRKELWTIYETKGHHQSAIGYHLAPLTWHCNFKEHLRDYIFLRRANGTAGIQNTAKELYRVLESVAVPKSQREDIKNAVLVGKSPHSTSSSSHRAEAERQLFANRTLLRTVIELYFYDFVIFGYEIPSLE